MKNLLGVSILTCGLVYGLLAVILVVACLVLGEPVAFAFVACIVVILVQFLVSPWLTDLVQRWLYKTDFDSQMPSYLDKFVDDVCARHNMKRPRLGYIDDGAPNAFTYGRTKNDARVVLTRGIFELLDEEEVKAVVAHELGHAVHYDMLIMTMAQLVPMVMYGVYSAFMRVSQSSRGGSSNSNSQTVTAVIALVAYVFYVVSQFLILWLSRTREYYADRFSAQVTGNPDALASALVNIGFGLSTRQESQKAKSSASATSTIGIFDTKNSKSMVVCCYQDGKVEPASIKNAMKWELWNVWAFWYEIGSTHPLISKRLIALADIAASMGQKPFVTFDERKPESYVDDFARELFITCMPVLGFLGFLGVFFASAFTAHTNAQLAGSVVWLGAAFVAAMVLSCLKYHCTHPRRDYHEANVAGLLGEVKVSMVASIPCELKGTVIGRGDPGCIFNEDYVLQDETGIIFVDYNQPLWILNKVFALFKSQQNIGRKVTVRGWYRRNMVPFFELYSMDVDGREVKCYSYGFGWAWRLAVLALTILAL